MDFYERAAGARLHVAYFRPGGVAYNVAGKLVEDIYAFSLYFYDRVDEIEDLLTNNRL